MKLSVIIVNYNVKYYVEQCLNSLSKALDGIESEIIVVDNHSRDGSVEYLRRRFKDVNIIDSNHNLGFARANNIAYRQSTGEYVLLLNPDTFVGEDTIASVIAFMDAHPDAGAAGVKMHNIDGTLAKESRRGLPTPMTSFYKMCGLCSRFPKSRRFGRYYMSYLGWDTAERIEVISGAFFFLRRSAIEQVGCLDEDFFMYGEDIDLSYRLLKGGYENWYLPYPILHYKGESTHKTSFAYVHVFYQAMLIFFRKHYGHFSFWLAFVVQFAIYFRAMLALLQMVPANIRKSLGFVNGRPDDTKYIFVGRAEMVESCMSISRHKGLVAEGHVTDTPDMKDGVVGKEGTRQTFIVFDTGLFSYKRMLEIMSANPQGRMKIGTYNNSTRTIITPNDIIR